MPFTEDDIRRRVLYVDDDLLILDKPTGLPVHAGTKIQQHLEELLDGVRFGLEEAPRLIHRLDKDTSGCLVLGRNREAVAALGKLFARQRVEKLYWAVVAGIPAEAAGRIDCPLRKIAGDTGAKVVRDSEGKPAITDYRVVASASGRSWLELRPRTGRTHQLRAHCAEMGWPILGDPIYGPEKPAPVPLHLHARAIHFVRHGAPPVLAVAPLPDHMAAAFAAAGFDESMAGQGETCAPTPHPLPFYESDTI